MSEELKIEFYNEEKWRLTKKDGTIVKAKDIKVLYSPLSNKVLIGNWKEAKLSEVILYLSTFDVVQAIKDELPPILQDQDKAALLIRDIQRELLRSEHKRNLKLKISLSFS